jgi:hypothetical protein
MLLYIYIPLYSPVYPYIFRKAQSHHSSACYSARQDGWCEDLIVIANWPIIEHEGGGGQPWLISRVLIIRRARKRYNASETYSNPGKYKRSHSRRYPEAKIRHGIDSSYYSYTPCTCFGILAIYDVFVLSK